MTLSLLFLFGKKKMHFHASLTFCPSFSIDFSLFPFISFYFIFRKDSEPFILFLFFVISHGKGVFPPFFTLGAFSFFFRHAYGSPFFKRFCFY